MKLARSAKISVTRAGVIIIMLSAGAALLPVLGTVPGTFAIGTLLIAAGVVETIAGCVRHETRTLATLTGAVTTGAGMMFALNPDGDLLPSMTVVIGWLLARSAILLVTSRRAHGSVKTWLGLSAATDFGLVPAFCFGATSHSSRARNEGPSAAVQPSAE
jgi:uncharacterized membrane protein HdeD (DUF308 family)